MSQAKVETELVPLAEFEQLDHNENDKPQTPTIAINDVMVEEEQADIAEFIPTPPDGGYGWVIVLSSFVNHFIVDGICYAFAAFMSTYSEYFNTSTAVTSALMSTLIGCYMLLGEDGNFHFCLVGRPHHYRVTSSPLPRDVLTITA